jgi:hypothetical protein
MDSAPLAPEILPLRESAVLLSVDGRPTCGARKKSGKRCLLLAGHGTVHPGYGPCKYHMGHMKETQQRAARDQMQDLFNEKVRLGEISPDAEPEEVLLQEVARAHAAVDAFDAQVLALSEEERLTNQGRVLISMWNKQREMLATVSRIALAAGVQERQTQVLEIQAMGVIKALDAVVNSAELDLTPIQRAAARRLLAGELRQISMSEMQRMEMQEIETGG